MKKRVLSLFLCMIMIGSFALPYAEATPSEEEQTGLELLGVIELSPFVEEEPSDPTGPDVLLESDALPTLASGEEVAAMEMLNLMELSALDESDGFLVEPSGPLPAIPSSGFLQELDEFLTKPGKSGLMTAVAEPHENAAVITSAEELLAITGGNYRLDRDLDLSGITNWTGITAEEELTLDGQGHCIKGLSGPLFKSAGSALTLRNLIVETVEEGVQAAGIIIEGCSTTLKIDNCTVKGDIAYRLYSAWSGGGYGAFAGKVSDSASSITNCAFIGTVDLNDSKKSYAGGIVGTLYGSVSDCYVQGSVKGAGYVGGVVGYAPQGNASIQRCCVEVVEEISGSNYAGGIAAHATYTTIRDCGVTTAENASICGDNYTGGIVGYGLAVTNSWFRGTLGADGKTTKDIAGIAAALKEFCTWSYAVVEFIGESSTRLGGIAGQTTTYIADCAAQVTATGTGTNVGGIVGVATQSVERCWAQGSLNGGGGIAGKCSKVMDCGAFVAGVKNGIVGEDSASVYNCYVNGPITLTRSGIGGKEVVNCAVRSATCYYAGITYGGAASGCLVQDCVITGGPNVGGIAAAANQAANCRVVGCTITGTHAGGIVGMNASNAAAGTIYGCTVEDTVITGTSHAGGVAGLCEMSSITECTTGNVTVTADAESGYAGGIVGEGEREILACEANCAVSGFYAGGIAGLLSHYRTALILSCRTTGEVTGIKYAGGIAGYFFGHSGINDCVTEADVNGLDCIGGVAGTIGHSPAYQSVITNCTASGTLSALEPAEGTSISNGAKYMGGLVGYSCLRVKYPSPVADALKNPMVRGCTFSGSIERAAGCTGGLIGGVSSGGIAVGDTYTMADFYPCIMIDCHVTKPLTPVSVPEGCYLGGMCGYAEDELTHLCLYGCTGAGLKVTGDLGYVGGLVGESTNAIAELCTINGDVIATDSNGSMDAGGLFGYAILWTKAAGCWINGDVIFNAPVDCGGLLLGSTYQSKVPYLVYFGYYDCGVLQSASDPGFSMKVNGFPLDRVFFGKNSSVDHLSSYTYTGIVNVERPVIVNVLGAYYGGASGFPIAGAKVSVGDCTGYTDSTGQVELDCGPEVYQGLSTITIERDGYESIQRQHAFATNMSVYTATLWRLDPGKIGIKDGSVEMTSAKIRNLFSSNKIRFLQKDKNAYPVSVAINWNGHTGDKVYLVGEESGRKVDLTVTEYGAYGDVCFGASFDAGENIKIVACTTNDPEFGVIESSRTISCRVEPTTVHIVVREEGEGATLTQNKEEKGEFFLESTKVKFDLADLADCAASISLENDILTITFTEDDSTKRQGNLFSSKDMYLKDNLSMAGSLSIPLTDSKNGYWAGKLKLGYNVNTGFSDFGPDEMRKKIDAVEKDLPIHENIHTFYVAGVPCYVKADLGVFGGVALEIYGRPEEAGVKGIFNGGFTGSVGGGVGGRLFEDVLVYNDKAAIEVMAGIFGDISGDAKIIMDAPKGIDVDPVIKGSIGGQVTVHIFFLDLQEKLTLGDFKWNKEGVKWTFAGESGGIELFSADTENWKLMERSSCDSVSLLAGSDIIIANSPASDTAASTRYDSNAFYTADDPSVEAQQNAMKLYAYTSNGTSILLDDTPTSDHSPAADGNCVVWVDVAEQEKADLAGFLMGGEVVASIYDQNTKTYSEKVVLSDPDDNAHVYSPVILKNIPYSQVIAAWLQSDDVMENGELNLAPDTTEIWFSLYDGTSWSPAALAAEVEGDLRSLHAVAANGAAALEYQLEDTVQRIQIDWDGNITAAKQVNEGVRHYVRSADGSRYAWVTEEGLFQGQYNSSTGKYTGRTIKLEKALNENPIVRQNGTYWACGNEIWYAAESGDPVMVARADGPVHDLSIVQFSNYDLRLLYLADTEDGTHVYCHNGKAQHPIESITQSQDFVEVMIRCNRLSDVTLRVHGEQDSLYGYSDYKYVVKDGYATIWIPKEDLPAGDVLTVTTATDSRTFELEEILDAVSLSIEDAYWDGSTLNTLILAGEKAAGDLTFTLADWATGETVLAWQEGKDYQIGAQYLSRKETTGLTEGAYLLTASLENASASTLIGKPAEPGHMLEVESWTSESGSTEVVLRDQGHILNADTWIFAAEYTQSGQMSQIAGGTLASTGTDRWNVMFPVEIGAGGSIFALDRESYLPLSPRLILDSKVRNHRRVLRRPGLRQG